MKEIKLTQGRVTLVDDEDFKWLSQWKWYYSSYGYAVRKKQTNKKQITIFMHREILKPPENKYTDHIDCNGLNNMRSNLRVCTNMQNQMNRRKANNASSNFKGVSWHKKNNSWQAYIRINQIFYSLGSFKIEKDAASAYDRIAKEWCGQFARLNFPDELEEIMEGEGE